MYMLDHDIRQLEMQLYGFDAALAATGALGTHEAFKETLIYSDKSRLPNERRTARMGA